MKSLEIFIFKYSDDFNLELKYEKSVNIFILMIMLCQLMLKHDSEFSFIKIPL